MASQKHITRPHDKISRREEWLIQGENEIEQSTY
jgi:hypothetical protein